MKRILALDIGSVRIGIAITDELCIIASPYESYTRKNLKTDLAYIAKLIKEKDVGLVVCGLPVSIDGSENSQTEYTKGFTEKLKDIIDVPLEYFDERYSTITANEALIEFNVRRDKRKSKIDKIAASVILQNYLINIKK